MHPSPDNHEDQSANVPVYRFATLKGALGQGCPALLVLSFVSLPLSAPLKLLRPNAPCSLLPQHQLERSLWQPV